MNIKPLWLAKDVNIKLLWLASSVLLVAIIFTAGMVVYSNQGEKLKAAQDQVGQFQMEIANLKQDVEDKGKVIGEKDKANENLQKKIDALQKEKGPYLKINGITAKLDEGTVPVLGWHDIDFSNHGDQALREVKVTITVTGDKGRQVSQSKYFGIWAIGQKQRVQFGVNDSTIKPQKVSMTGLCNEGIIDLTWTVGRN